MFDEKEIEDLCEQFLSLDDNIFLGSVDDISKVEVEVINEPNINIVRKLPNLNNINDKSSSNNNGNINNFHHYCNHNKNNYNLFGKICDVSLDKSDLNTRLDIVNENFMNLPDDTFVCHENRMDTTPSDMEDSLEATFKLQSRMNKKEDEIDNEFKEIDEKLISPDVPVKQDYFQRNGWLPNTCQLWRSGPSSLNLDQASSNHVPQKGLTSSVTYNSNEPQSLNAFLSSSKRIYSHQQLGVKVEMVYSLLSMLDMNNREDMSKTFLAMSSSPESCHAMRQSGCLPLLIQLIHSSELNKDVRERAAEALHNIVHSQTDEGRRKREVRVLKLLQQVREFCDDLKNSSTQEILQWKESDKHPVNAIGTLMKFSFDAEHRQAICVLGGLHAISELLQVDHEVHGNTNDGSPCTTLRRYAGMSLTNLTFGDCKNKALLCSFNKFMYALVDQLKSPCEDLRQVTASVIRNLSWRADSDSKQALRDVGTVTSLTASAMEAKKESTLKSILSALWNLSAHCSLNKIDICSVPGALAFLVKTLKYKSSSNTLAIVENAGGILRNISSHIAVREDYRQILRENNCFEVLLEQLKSPSLTVVSNACGTLWNLSARCPADQKKLWEMGATSMLRSLVQSKHKMISMGSSAALKNLLAANPNGSLLTHLDSTAKSLGLQNLPTLFVRKKRALEQELNITLAETCENIDPVESPSQFNSLQCETEVKKGNGPRRSDSRDSVQSTQSDSTYERLNQITLKNEEKLFENASVTLHDSLNEKSIPRKMVDQKLMRRYKSSMIPTPTFKKVNQDRINEKAKEGSTGENCTHESFAKIDFKENGILDSKEASRNRISVLSNTPKNKISQSTEDCFSPSSISVFSNDLDKGKQQELNEDEVVEHDRKSSVLAKTISNSPFYEGIRSNIDHVEKTAKKLNAYTQVQGLNIDPLCMYSDEKHEQFFIEEMTRNDTSKELNNNSRKREKSECSLYEKDLPIAGKTALELSGQNSQKEPLSVDFSSNGNENINKESSKNSKFTTSGIPTKIIPKGSEFCATNEEASTRLLANTQNLSYDNTSGLCSISPLKLQKTGNQNENITDAVMKYLPVAAENISCRPTYIKGSLNGTVNIKSETAKGQADSIEGVPQSTSCAKNEIEALRDTNVDTIHVKTFSDSILPKFKLGSPITDSNVLQMDANKICREIKKHQDFEMGCSLSSEMSLVSSSSFLDTGDYSLFECSAETVDLNDADGADPGKVSSKLKSLLLRKSTTSQNAESVSLPSLESLKNEQVEALDLDSSILSVASITSETAETCGKDFDTFNTYTKTYKVDAHKDFVEDTAVDATLVSNEDDTLNADLLQNNPDIFDEDNSLHSQENLPLDNENFSNQLKKKLTPKEKRKTFHDRYRTYTIKDLNGFKGISADIPQGLNVNLRENNQLLTDSEFDSQHHSIDNETEFYNVGNEGAKPCNGQQGVESFSETLPSGNLDTLFLSKKFDKVQDFTDHFLIDSKSLNEVLHICPTKRKELVDNAKLVAFSLKTAVVDCEAISDSEIEDPHIEIDTATYNKNFKDVKFGSHGVQSVQHYEEHNEESSEEDLEKKGARILKPEEKSHEKQEVPPKGIRGRRRQVYSTPLKHPLRPSGSPINLAKAAERMIETKKSGSETCTPPVLNREGTFTKEDGPAFKKNEVKNCRSIPVLCKNNETRNSTTAKSGSKPGQVSGNAKRQNQVTRIVRSQSAVTTKTNERRPESDSNQRRPSTAVLAHRTKGDTSGTSRKFPSTGLASPKMRNSSSSQNVRTENNFSSGFSKSKNLTSQTIKSQSDASLNLVACKDMVSPSKQRSPRKEVTSKIASLWRKVEEAKQQNKSLKDQRVWINSEKPPKADDELLVIEQEEILDIPSRKIVHSLTCQTLSDETFKDSNPHSKSSKNFYELSKFRGVEERREKIERRNVISAVIPPYNYSPPLPEKKTSSKIADADAFPKGSLKTTTV